ncbi:MAG: hypothetical protein HN353_11225 [Bdellovibrionales bacterium]|jgi:hypothetical protein|nr:hypothetical protein [Bdellovibrionales bacterium]MBT3525159.1 hypothetical protein [Bdellovibrionales bacterium]MBT7669102.1 hypothetical protein [Bdellovibrionales bacterium]
MRIRKWLVGLLILVLIGGVTSATGREILQFNYYNQSKGNQSIDEILIRFLRKGQQVVSNDKMMIKIVDANPHITSWQQIPQNERVQLFIFRGRANLVQIKRYLIARRELLELERQDMSIGR